jgi:hypothetical protein
LKTPFAAKSPCLLSAAVLSLVAACGGSDVASEQGITEHGSTQLVSLNGRKANGPVLNGRKPNGTALDGLFVASVNLAGATQAGAALTGVSLAKSSFSATTAAKKTITGTALAGATFTATLSDGSTLPIKVDAVSQLAAPNADLLGYSVSYQTASSTSALCGYELDGSAVQAVPVIGSFNYGQGVTGGGSYTTSTSVFTFACRHYAIEKCIEFGYAPWKNTNGTTLQNAWVACTRMLRADYCGDGTPNTVDGTIIDVYDRYNIQTVSMPAWPVEAEWGTAGANCLTPNVKDRYVLAGNPTPSCYAAKAKTGCGSFTSASTYLIDRYLF